MYKVDINSTYGENFMRDQQEQDYFKSLYSKRVAVMQKQVEELCDKMEGYR